MDHLSVGLNSVSQSVLVRRLLLRQLRATLSKGQVFSLSLRSFLSGLLLTADVLLSCCGHAGQWSMSGELCCVLSLDQPYTERTTHFLSVPNNANAPLEWSEEITLLVGVCSVKTATNVCLLCTFLSTVKALTKYIFNQLQMLCRKNWVLPQLQDFTTFESEADCHL